MMYECYVFMLKIQKSQLKQKSISNMFDLRYKKRRHL